jgi:endonuclease/exonuclease/phosphatase (EEP) superfamily protein YafD
LTGQYDKDHRKVKALGTYLNWTKVPLGGEEVHILNVYLEPGLESFVGKRAETVINLAKDIIKQDPASKIIIGGDLNGKLKKLHIFVTMAGFTPAQRAKTPTHREGKQLDQLWVRNLSTLNAIVGDPIDKASDHNLIQVTIEAVCIQREQQIKK